MQNFYVETDVFIKRLGEYGFISYVLRNSDVIDEKELITL